jgi:hypothetical protein
LRAGYGILRTIGILRAIGILSTGNGILSRLVRKIPPAIPNTRLSDRGEIWLSR